MNCKKSSITIITTSIGERLYPKHLRSIIVRYFKRTRPVLTLYSFYNGSQTFDCNGTFVVFLFFVATVVVVVAVVVVVVVVVVVLLLLLLLAVLAVLVLLLVLVLAGQRGGGEVEGDRYQSQ